jgi:hypothetical protein
MPETSCNSQKTALSGAKEHSFSKSSAFASNSVSSFGDIHLAIERSNKGKPSWSARGCPQNLPISHKTVTKRTEIFPSSRRRNSIKKLKHHCPFHIPTDFIGSPLHECIRSGMMQLYAVIALLLDLFVKSMQVFLTSLRFWWFHLDDLVLIAQPTSRAEYQNCSDREQNWGCSQHKLVFYTENTVNKCNLCWRI